MKWISILSACGGHAFSIRQQTRNEFTGLRPRRPRGPARPLSSQVRDEFVAWVVPAAVEFVALQGRSHRHFVAWPCGHASIAASCMMPHDAGE